MRKFIGAGLATLAVVGTMVAAPAQAHGWGGGWHGGGWHGGGWGGGGALFAGIAGLAVGAAIADSARPHYYYYGPGPGYYYGPTCWTSWRWDPYYGNVPVRVCR